MPLDPGAPNPALDDTNRTQNHHHCPGFPDDLHAVTIYKGQRGFETRLSQNLC